MEKIINGNDFRLKLYKYFFLLGQKGGCHQRQDRSFFICGYQFPVCSRCAGILIGQLLGIIIYAINIIIPFYIDICFLLIMFLDWFIQYKKIKESANIRRFITGNLAGIAQTSILIKIVLFVISKMFY